MPDDSSKQPVTVDDRRQEREREFGQYVAVRPIDLEGARAFNTGDPVPAGHVARGVVPDGSVKKRDLPAPSKKES